MRLTELLNKIKEIPDISKDIFTILVIFLMSLGGFALGRLSIIEEKRHDELRIIAQKASEKGVLGVTEGDTGLYNTKLFTKQSPISGVFVGSKSGKVYYPPWCAAVKRIHDENKIWFASKDDAEAKGYRPSTSCQGT